MDPTPSQREVVIVDIRMPFVAMVWLMVQWALASIPALLILVAIILPPALAILFVIGGLGLLR